jgi:hypothetical protein
MMMHTRFLPVLFLTLLCLAVQAQADFPDYEKPLLTQQDAVYSASLPLLSIPKNHPVRDLPAIHDNSQSPYLRPVFGQNGACCGQASGIAYNFTYEINRARNLSSADSVNQYPSHFTWNFMNGGYGYYGVSYLHSFEIVKWLGNPNVPDYGGFDEGEGIHWISGYDKYYNGMKNRLRSVSRINVGTPEGLEVLKHWLHNHLDGSETGGIASFYSGSPYGLKTLPEGTPEAGKKVVANFPGNVAAHAMAIVGYNDSIRYDYNEDGLYTNHLDINDDGMVDMRDWEIGGVKFVNSYGVTFADSGFCYMTYKTLADDLNDGGIWNQTVHVLDVKPDYEPLLTMKFTIRHDSREKIKITAGVASDTSALKPDYTLSFPVFDYQGGHQYMQGYRGEEIKKSLEAGLDVTPLLSYVESGNPAKFFLQIHENDPLNEGTGRIIGFTLMDYTNGITEIPSGQTDLPLNENATTRLAIVHSPVFEKTDITTEELPAITAGSYSYQLEAANGQQPYRWTLTQPFHQQRFDFPLPEIDDEMLTPQQPHLPYAAKQLDFSFPFYGHTYDTVYIFDNGFITFEPGLYPWPYYNDPYILFKSLKNISAFNFTTIEYYNDPLKDATEIWYEGDENYAAFRWKGPLYYFEEEVGEGEYALLLYPDGKVDFYYNGISMNEDIVWYAGVSSGDDDYTLLKNAASLSVPDVSSYRLTPASPPQGLTLNKDGLLSGTPGISEEIYNLTFKVTDDRLIENTKTLQLSDGLIFSWIANGGDDQVIQAGETVAIDLTVKNIHTEPFSNLTANLIINDPFLEGLNLTANIGNLQSGQETTIQNAFAVNVATTCPNHFTFVNELSLSGAEADWHGTLPFTAFAPELLIDDSHISDDDNQRLDPGETAEFLVNLTNTGEIEIDNIQVALSSNNPLITFKNPVQQLGNAPPGIELRPSFLLTADENIEIGTVVEFTIQVDFAPKMTLIQKVDVVIGQFTILLFNKATNTFSADAITDALNHLGIEPVYSEELPEDLEMYRAVFVCLGGILTNQVLTDAEGVQLAGYLNMGGNIYLEGPLTWWHNQQTAVHPFFKSVAQSAGWAGFNAFEGVAGSFAEGLAFDYFGEHNVLPAILFPQTPAFSLFYADGNPERTIVTAHPAEEYKTIGAVHQFGNMGNEANWEHRVDYMDRMLLFFGLGEFVVNVEEQATVPTGQLTINTRPNPFTNHVVFEIQALANENTTIEIFDLSGNLVQRKVLHTAAEPENQSFLWDGTNNGGNIVLPGIYIYQIKAGNRVSTGKLIKAGQ